MEKTFPVRLATDHWRRLEEWRGETPIDAARAFVRGRAEKSRLGDAVFMDVVVEDFENRRTHEYRCIVRRECWIDALALIPAAA